MAETKVINLEVKTNIDETTKSFDKLGKSIDNAQKSTNNLDATFDEVYGDLKPLTARMGEAEDRLYELGLAGKQATYEYKGLLNAVGNYRKVQIQTDLVVDAAAQTLGQKFGASIQGVTGAFAGVQGAMGLIGVESEGVEKALLRVQSAMALSEGLKGIREAFPAFKNLGDVIKTNVVGAFSSLKTALISTGIGALVIGVGLLIANFDKLKNSISKNLANAQKFVDSTKQQGDAARATANDFAEYERTLKRLGYTEEQIYKKRGDKLKGAISGTEKEIEANKKLYKEQLANLETAYKFDKIGLNATGRALYGSEEDAAKTRENISNLRKELVKLKNDQFEYDEQQKKSKEQDDKTTEAVVKNTKKKVVAKEEDKSKNQELIDNANALNEALAESDAARQKAKEDQAAADAKMRADGLEKLKEDARKQLEINKQLQDQKIQAVQNTLSTIGNLAELFAGKSRKQQETAFKIQKAANIASTLIDTYLGAQKAYTSQIIPLDPTSVIRGALAAAAVVTAGLLNVKKITSTKFEGGGATGGGGGGTPSIGGGGGAPQSVITPNFNIVGNNGTNQLEQLKQAPIQAYVVSGEMSTQQSLDRNRLRNATL